MAVTSGFFNAVNGDRKYDAEDFGALFDGIIRDGVFKGVGNQLQTRWTTGRNISVDTGRAWFRRTWTDNNSPLQLSVEAGDPVYNRKDAVVLRIDKTQNGRRNTIYVKKGPVEGARNNVLPSLDNSASVLEVLLAEINIPKNATALTAGSIVNRIGSDQCPWITAPLEYLTTESLTNRLQAEWSDWTRDRRNEFTTWFEQIKKNLGDAGGIAELTNKVDQAISGLAPDLIQNYNVGARLHVGRGVSSIEARSTIGSPGQDVADVLASSYGASSFLPTSRGFRIVKTSGCVVSPTPDGRGWDVRIVSTPANFDLEVDMNGISSSNIHGVAFMHTSSAPSSVSDWRCLFGGYYIGAKWDTTATPNVIQEVFTDLGTGIKQPYGQKSNLRFLFPGFQQGTVIKIRGLTVASTDAMRRMHNDNGTYCIPVDFKWVKYASDIRLKSNSGSISKNSFVSSFFGPDCIVTKQIER